MGVDDLSLDGRHEIAPDLQTLPPVLAAIRLPNGCSIVDGGSRKAAWKVKDFRHEVKSVKFAKKTTQKQMNYGAAAITVYPVKVLYTQITDYKSKDTARTEVGADGV